MKILMVIAPSNFRDEELLKPKALFESQDHKVTVASKGVSTSTGMLGAAVKIDLDLSQVNANDYDAVIFVGGSGASVYFNDPLVLNLARQAFSAGKVVAAICIAPSILANAGLLKNKKATSSSSEQANLESKEAQYTGEGVTVHGRIITANGPSAAEEFGKAIIKLLKQSA